LKYGIVINDEREGIKQTMNLRPKAVEDFELEILSADETATTFMEHPLDRLKYYILRNNGKILKSEFSIDGGAYVIWESEGKQYRAWSAWPDQEYKINWIPMT
jgi:hypothetical protein